jgi:hypothetical protein
MTSAIAFAQTADWPRAALVWSCALALILAGRALPFV